MGELPQHHVNSEQFFLESESPGIPDSFIAHHTNIWTESALDSILFHTVILFNPNILKVIITKCFNQ